MGFIIIQKIGGSIMMKKIILMLLIVLLIISGLLFSILIFVKSENKVTYSLEPFNETLKTPDFFSIVDYSMRQEGMSGKMSREERYNLSVMENKNEAIEKIINILNSKEFKTIEPTKFHKNYENIGNDIELHLLGGVDSDSASKYYYPFNIFILKNYTMFVESAKGGEFVYLKGSVTSDEYKYIKSLYDSSNKKEAY